MPIQRRCPKCSRDYPEAATLCINPACSNLDPQPPAALIAGTALPAATDEYTVIRVLGWGGMATTYLTTNRSGDQRAVKEMLPSGNPKVQRKLEAMFEREAHIQERLGHQLVANPPVFAPFPIGEGAFRAHGRLLMAMEFMPGEDLDKIQDRVGSIPFLQVLPYGIEICIILRDYLHGYVEMGIAKPVIHRDIKPANLHVLRTSNTACLLDFGISRFESFSAATMGRGGTRAGSPAFAMPEQLQKGKPISASTDIGSLCASLWALIANAKDFPDTRPDQLHAIRTFVQDVELQAVLIKGTDENPAGRYQSAEELRLELVRVHEAHQPLPVHLRPVTKPAPVPVATPTVAAPVPQLAGRYKIVWGKTPTVVMPNGTEYQRDLMGKVIEVHRFSRNQPVPAVNVVVADIVDSGGGHPTGVSRVLTDATGYFHLDQIDTRVPITVVERRLRIVVEETTGRPIHDETVRVNRPRTHAASQKAQQAGVWLKNHAGSFNQKAHKAGQWFKGHAGSSSSATATTNLYVLFAVVFTITGLVGVALKNPWLATLPFWLAFVSGRAANLSRRGKLPQSWRWAVYPRLSTIVIGSWLIFLIAHLVGR